MEVLLCSIQLVNMPLRRLDNREEIFEDKSRGELINARRKDQGQVNVRDARG